MLHTICTERDGHRPPCSGGPPKTNSVEARTGTSRLWSPETTYFPGRDLDGRNKPVRSGCSRCQPSSPSYQDRIWLLMLSVFLKSFVRILYLDLSFRFHGFLKYFSTCVKWVASMFLITVNPCISCAEKSTKKSAYYHNCTNN